MILKVLKGLLDRLDRGQLDTLLLPTFAAAAVNSQITGRKTATGGVAHPSGKC